MQLELKLVRLEKERLRLMEAKLEHIEAIGFQTDYLMDLLKMCSEKVREGKDLEAEK